MEKSEEKTPVDNQDLDKQEVSKSESPKDTESSKEDTNIEKPKKEQETEPEKPKERSFFSAEEKNKITNQQTNSTKIISILAVLLVVILGLGFYLYQNQSLPFFSKSKLIDTSPVTKEATSFNMEIKNPDDELLTYDKNLVVSGDTSDQAIILIFVNQNYLGFETDSSGQFSKVINLDTGINNIEITAFDNQGNQKSEKRMVYYSQEKL